MSRGWGIEEPETPSPYGGSETRSVTVSLGEGNFKFRYVKIVDVNNVERNVFGQGEDVYYSAQFCNDGGSKDNAEYTIKDMDTGAIIKSDTYPNMEPGACGTFSKQKLGAMPDRDWHLEFKVVP